MNLINLCASDLDFAYPQGSRWRKLGALIINPSIRAAVLIRLVQRSPRGLFWLFRNLLITFHSIDVGPDIRVGPRLSLPHPIGIVIGNGVVIGEGCRIFQNVTIGRTNEGYPVLGDNVTVYPNSVVVGELEIEAGRRIRAGSFLAPAHQKSRHE
jgi:serine O-acetyltransferase